MKQLINDKTLSTKGIVVVLLLTFIAFFPSLKNGFVDTWDDGNYFINNPAVHGLGLSNLKAIFGSIVTGTYVPLPLLTYAIEYKLFGLDPMPMHFLNLVLHLICVFLVFRVLIMLNIKPLYALFGALLFAVHPMKVESVAWLSERKDLMYSLFFLASMITYLSYLRSPGKKNRFMILTLIFFLMGLLSKIQMVTLPLTLLLLDYLSDRPLKMKLIYEKLPFFTLSLLFGISGAMFLQKDGVLELNQQFTLLQRLVFGLSTFTTYISKFFIPYPLSALYPHPVNPGEALPLVYYLNPLLVIAACYILFRYFRQNKAVIFGSLFFIFNIVFMLQILAAGWGYQVDRYTYIPYLGLIFILVWAIQNQLSENERFKIPVIVAFVLFCGVFSVMTWERCGAWKDNLSLWNDVISKYPEKQYLPYLYRGLTYNLEQPEEAYADFDRAILLNPACYQAYNNRGVLKMMKRDFLGSLDDLREAIKLKPGYTEAIRNHGITLLQLGDTTGGIDDWNRAAALGDLKSKQYLELLRQKPAY